MKATVYINWHLIDELCLAACTVRHEHRVVISHRFVLNKAKTNYGGKHLKGMYEEKKK